MIDALLKISKQEGFMALYSGLVDFLYDYIFKLLMNIKHNVQTTKFNDSV